MAARGHITGRQAIFTKYLGPTNYCGARVKAETASGLSKTVSWDYALGTSENHLRAALELADSKGWGGTWVGGGSAKGYVFVDVG